jgi:hypoxanthine phosphoribosyltransferase
MNKIYFTWDHIDIACWDIYKEITRDGFKPDLVIGLTRGGLVPATILSHKFDVPMDTVKISLRDHISKGGLYKDFGVPQANILIVDDINDTGATIKHLKQVWEHNLLANWSELWHKKIIFATIVDNISSEARVDYHYTTINKAEEDVWIVYPWEKYEN